jgi:hypothetical protein
MSREGKIMEIWPDSILSNIPNLLNLENHFQVSWIVRNTPVI